MGPSKQLAKDVKMKLIDVYKAEEGYKKTWKCFKVSKMAVQGNCERKGKIWKTKNQMDPQAQTTYCQKRQYIWH